MEHYISFFEMWFGLVMVSAIRSYGYGIGPARIVVSVVHYSNRNMDVYNWIKKDV